MVSDDILSVDGWFIAFVIFLILVTVCGGWFIYNRYVSPSEPFAIKYSDGEYHFLPVPTPIPSHLQYIAFRNGSHISCNETTLCAGYT